MNAFYWCFLFFFGKYEASMKNLFTAFCLFCVFGVVASADDENNIILLDSEQSIQSDTSQMGESQELDTTEKSEVDGSKEVDDDFPMPISVQKISRDVYNSTRYSGEYVKQGDDLFKIPIHLRKRYLDGRKMPRKSESLIRQEGNENIKSAIDSILINQTRAEKVLSIELVYNGNVRFYDSFPDDHDGDYIFANTFYSRDYSMYDRSMLLDWQKWVNYDVIITTANGKRYSCDFFINNKFVSYSTDAKTHRINQVYYKDMISDALFRDKNGDLFLINTNDRSKIYTTNDKFSFLRGELVGTIVVHVDLNEVEKRTSPSSIRPSHFTNHASGIPACECF